MLEECVALTRAGVPISAPSIDRYAAELERLTRERAALKRRFDVAHQKGLRALKRGDYHQFGKIIADERAIIDELARQKPTARKRKATKKR
jgi:hypothetical protein